ncbi:hypothetical protein OQJ26_18565 [Legionella sp. PATHC038]|uniref:hypothetical protein n=1 Tax=Legionella sheltonii TaxID=2992041 RepID=UPI0022435723|nr:hypothetical protein [Legionella sp. PATHC038]MCW8400789.1 hypothetical protein [Legionella sp. PATHC038]
MQDKDELEESGQSIRKDAKPSLAEVIGGEDITKHYLNEENKKFRIYRYNKEVYAVRLDEQNSNPIDFVHMWSSHKAEQKGVPKEQQENLGSGVYGTVYKMTYPPKIMP